MNVLVALDAEQKILCDHSGGPWPVPTSQWNNAPHYALPSRLMTHSLTWYSCCHSLFFHISEKEMYIGTFKCFFLHGGPALPLPSPQDGTLGGNPRAVKPGHWLRDLQRAPEWKPQFFIIKHLEKSKLKQTKQQHRDGTFSGCNRCNSPEKKKTRFITLFLHCGQINWSAHHLES